MKILNFATAVLCCVLFLTACSLSANAQSIAISLRGTTDTTGFGLNDFESTDDFAGISPATPITVDVFEDPEETLTLSFIQASTVDGISGAARLRFAGSGFGLSSPTVLEDPDLPIGDDYGNILPDNPFRFDADLGEMVTISFNEDVCITAITIVSLDEGETFAFGSATNITTSDPNFTTNGIFSFGPDGMPVAAGEGIPIQAIESVLGGSLGGIGLQTITLEKAANDNNVLLGDVNRDEIINFLDIAPFIQVLSSGEPQAEADIDQNGVVNFLDIVPFIQILASAGS